MPTFLFDRTVFGPIYSRRLGMSLGINLLPENRKLCNYNCIYCECGLTEHQQGAVASLPTRQQVRELLYVRLSQAKNSMEVIDTITFAGNGEPTLHPDFSDIVDDTIALRDRWLPNARVAVLSNATMLQDKKVRLSLAKADLNILKLDSAIEQTWHLINCPIGGADMYSLMEQLKKFNGNLIIQTLFFRGTLNDVTVDNTTDTEINCWLKALLAIKPMGVMIYTIARDTPLPELEKITPTELEAIGSRVREVGLEVTVSY